METLELHLWLLRRGNWIQCEALYEVHRIHWKVYYKGSAPPIYFLTISKVQSYMFVHLLHTRVFFILSWGSFWNNVCINAVYGGPEVLISLLFWLNELSLLSILSSSLFYDVFSCSFFYICCFRQIIARMMIYP